MDFEAVGCGILESHSQMPYPVFDVDNPAHFGEQLIGVCCVAGFRNNVDGKSVIALRNASGVNVVKQGHAWHVLDFGIEGVEIETLWRSLHNGTG